MQPAEEYRKGVLPAVLQRKSILSANALNGKLKLKSLSGGGLS
jgi:hypothetical protein